MPTQRENPGGIASQVSRDRAGSNGRPRGGRKATRDGPRRKARKRQPRDVPPEWVVAIAKHYPELIRLIVEWQRGSGEYLPMDELGGGYKDEWMFADDVSGDTRKKLKPDEVEKLAQEMGDDIWEYLCGVTDAEGPLVNFALTGYGITKGGEEYELFRSARACDLRSEQGLPVDRDTGDNDTHAALRWSTQSNRDLQGNFIKLAAAIADPLREVAGMIQDGAATHRAAVNGLEEVVREKAELELQKLKKQLSLKRLAAAERTFRYMWDAVVSDLGSELLHLQYMKYGGEPAPLTTIEACRELSTTFPVACAMWLDSRGDGDLGHDLMSAFAASANMTEEQEVAAIFRKLNERPHPEAPPRLSPYVEGIRQRLSKRTRIVWRILVGRLLMHHVEL